MLKGSPLRIALILTIGMCIVILLSSLVLTTFFPNNTTCVGGLCIPNEASALSPPEQLTSFFGELFTTKNWPKRWFCGSWNGYQGWTYILADTITFISYFGIPAFLAFYIRRRKADLKSFRKLLWLFAFFIFFCGLTHLFDTVAFWYPMYNWMALMKVFTAGISFVTFLTLTYESKHLIELRGPKKLQELIDKQTHELKDINKKLEEEIAQNELLFKEMHHRIKNNLQMVASLVRLKASMGMAPAEIAARVEKRIRSMSRVHDLLLHNKSIETITLHVYIKELVDSVYHSFHNNNVSIHEQVSDDIEIDTETAITLGLLLSEAITNAFKYAFPENESGEITIRAREIEIIIADDGKGYEKASEKKSGGMGQIIMENLVSNLRGKMDVKSGTKGTTIAITFRP